MYHSGVPIGVHESMTLVGSDVSCIAFRVLTQLVLFAMISALFGYSVCLPSASMSVAATICCQG